MLNPGIRLLGTMKMPQKMLLIAIIFLIPIAYLLFVYERALTAQIEFSQMELEGVRQIAPIRKIIQNMQVHRGVSQMALAGNAGARTKLAEFRANIKAAIAEFQITESDQSKKECLVDWFKEQQVEGEPVSDNLAKAMATIMRLPASQRGGGKRSF